MVLTLLLIIVAIIWAVIGVVAKPLWYLLIINIAVFIVDLIFPIRARASGGGHRRPGR